MATVFRIKLDGVQNSAKGALAYSINFKGLDFGSFKAGGARCSPRWRRARSSTPSTSSWSED